MIYIALLGLYTSYHRLQAGSHTKRALPSPETPLLGSKVAPLPGFDFIPKKPCADPFFFMLIFLIKIFSITHDMVLKATLEF